MSMLASKKGNAWVKAVLTMHKTLVPKSNKAHWQGNAAPSVYCISHTIKKVWLWGLLPQANSRYNTVQNSLQEVWP